MRDTVLCYLEKDGAWLMMNRVKKKYDLNEGKWVAVGGKLEENESPIDCAIREVKEETGFTLNSASLCGIVTFVSDKYETEQMFIFRSSDFCGNLNPDCNEGILEWQPICNVNRLPIWEGDKIFHKFLIENSAFFNLKLVYSGDNLTDAYLEGKKLVL